MRIFLTLLILPALCWSQDTLRAVDVKANTKSLKRSFRTTTNTMTVTGRELLKAACCNLAESFETNPTVDVNYPDAVSGTKQIKILGLTTPYLLVTEGNIPSVRGASQAFGLSFTPGTWIESIQVTKGAGPVVNGYESIAGQINTELLKPLTDIPFYLNFYGSSDSRFEGNAQVSAPLSEKWGTGVYLHTEDRISKNDMNDDGFLDNPLGKQVHLMNRWQYDDDDNGLVGFATIKYLDDEKQSGELAFDPKMDRGTTNHWGSVIRTRRFEASAKVGYVFHDRPYQSIGWQNAVSNHDQDSYFGLNRYDINQQSIYSNLIFNSIIGNTMHKFSTGISFINDRYAEMVAIRSIAADFGRTDTAVGAFFEYNYDDGDKLSFSAGARVDSHNRLGVFATPRIHLRYTPWNKAAIRLSAGRGKRAANIFSENQNLFASSREFSVESSRGKLYGLHPEIAWNYGISMLQGFTLFDHAGEIGIDLYRTDFQNQVVADVYQSGKVSFYDLSGKSFASSLQVDANYEIITHLNVRAAYKFYDVRSEYNTGTFERPLQAKHRVFANAEFATHIKEHGSQWKFDLTYNWIGSQRLPAVPNQRLNEVKVYSDPFTTINAQVTRTFSGVFEMYSGMENATNYRQRDAILGADQPFGNKFDASIVYAPLFGRMIYAGLRFKIKSRK